MRIHQPGRVQSKVPATVATPHSSTGGQLTHVGISKPLAPGRILNSSQNPLTVQRQGFAHPLKQQRYK